MLGGHEEERHASSDESAAVAAAIGLRNPGLEGASKSSPLYKVESARTEFSESGTEQSPDADTRLMKSPQLQNLESPELSGESAFGDDDMDGPSSPGFDSRAPNFEIGANGDDEVASVIEPAQVPLDEVALMKESTNANSETEGSLSMDGKTDTETLSSTGGGTWAENEKPT
ncbi:hypothetical protein EJ08DRAFT_191788 [Tothia fuscella]|uniref:Uncharacterized protein n=1 Tax=Tothia fuscella TaxID=1048955 RepID=A0A9P4NS92_9PEZI|nr:hypothetical protein EJ08DRAFT_191788 [Tothia fuscella]